VVQYGVGPFFKPVQHIVLNMFNNLNLAKPKPFEAKRKRFESNFISFLQNLLHHHPEHVQHILHSMAFASLQAICRFASLCAILLFFKHSLNLLSTQHHIIYYTFSFKMLRIPPALFITR